jgi:hypothetical protein
LLAAFSPAFLAAFESAFQIGMGLSEMFTPPLFGANRYAAAAQLMVAQGIAEANGARTGSSGGAARPAPAGAAAGNAMLRRPDSRANGGTSGAVTQIWFRNRVVGEAVAEDLNDVARRGGRRIASAAVGGGNRRSLGS